MKILSCQEEDRVKEDRKTKERLDLDSEFDKRYDKGGFCMCKKHEAIARIHDLIQAIEHHMIAEKRELVPIALEENQALDDETFTDSEIVQEDIKRVEKQKQLCAEARVKA